MKTIIVDIDGTIAKISEERLAILNKKPIDYDAFYRCDFTNDEPILTNVGLIVSLFFDSAYPLVFCTGRREQCRGQTTKWIRNNVSVHISENCTLLMRPDGDERSDMFTKPELIKNEGYTPDNVAFILEDRSVVTKKYRELGFTCLQVADGNY